LTVEWTTGTPYAFTVLTVETAFLSKASWSIERTSAIWVGCQSINRKAQFCGVKRWSASGSRIGWLVTDSSPSSF
jgi:hypothetical protein